MRIYNYFLSVIPSLERFWNKQGLDAKFFCNKRKKNKKQEERENLSMIENTNGKA